MALKKLGILPDSQGYKVSEGDDSIRTALDGGLGRQRRYVLGASKTVTCRWSLNRSSYDYLRAFYNSVTGKSANFFTADLIIDGHDIEEHTCQFIPKTLELVEQRGLLYVVSATLEVKPIPRTEGYEAIIVVLFQEFGENYDQLAGDMFNALNQLVNIDLDAI